LTVADSTIPTIRLPIYNEQADLCVEGSQRMPGVPLHLDQSYREYERYRYNMEYGCVEYREIIDNSLQKANAALRERVIQLAARIERAHAELTEDF
jgi:hypothetical protein